MENITFECSRYRWRIRNTPRTSYFSCFVAFAFFLFYRLSSEIIITKLVSYYLNSISNKHFCFYNSYNL